MSGMSRPRRRCACWRRILTIALLAPSLPAARLPAAVLTPAVAARLPAVGVGRAAVLAAELRF